MRRCTRKASGRRCARHSTSSRRATEKCSSCGIRDCRTTRSPRRRGWRAAPSARPSPARAAGWWRRSRREGQVNMSHVDDGTLHAYLDAELSPVQSQDVEAHIAQCPGCRDRLEEERALIARADELLGLAAPPDRATPPFRPGDPEPPVRLWWRVRLPLAWAATVVLALGAGMYFGPRALQREQPAVDQRTGDLAAKSTLPPAAAPENGATSRAAPLPVRRTRAPAATSAVVERKSGAKDKSMEAVVADRASTAEAARPETAVALRARDERAAGALQQPVPRPALAPSPVRAAAGSRGPGAPPGPGGGAADPGPATALVFEVRGPLPPDSLAALQRRLQPLRP